MSKQYWLQNVGYGVFSLLCRFSIQGRPMLPARLLAWYPKAALGSAVR